MDEEQTRVMDAVEQATSILANEFRTKSGVILRTRKVKTSIVRNAWKALKEPKPPMIWIEALGRYEENPNDPSYGEAIGNYNLARADATQNVYLMLGCDVKYVPDGYPLPGDDSWTEALEELELTIPSKDKPGARKVAWLLYHVLEDQVEQAELQKQIMRMSGLVLEEDVKEAEDSFPDK